MEEQRAPHCVTVPAAQCPWGSPCATRNSRGSRQPEDEAPPEKRHREGKELVILFTPIVFQGNPAGQEQKEGRN